jgi:dimethylargininase
LKRIEIDSAEPFGANVVRIGDTVLCSAAAPKTRARLENRGLQIRAVDLSELAKAEGALTCCSLIVA